MPSAELPGLVIYPVLLALVLGLYVWRRSRRERRNISVLREAESAGLTEPASLHPLIDSGLCVGCGSCVSACPEGNVLGLISNTSRLINPTHCIGHGACRTACPTGAIQLVFGTAKRGVDIPLVGPDFQTNVPGIYIAGELGGMGLIRNAIEQGRQAMDALAKTVCGASGEAPAGYLDALIVGAGPSGFSASLAAMEKQLNVVTVEQDSLGGTVAHYPRGKLVMTAPVRLPLIGKVNMRETSKEALLQFWQGVEQKTCIKIRYGERLESVQQLEDGFVVRTTRNEYRTRAILLAIGRRGTPRRLDVPGEDREKVVYRMIDPQQYRGRHVLVVGGGDSALEAAVSLAEEPGTTVTISYRGEAFSRAKEKNRQKIEEGAQRGLIRVMLQSRVRRIDEHTVHVTQDGRDVELDNDAVIVCAGGILPTPFLKTLGIVVETHHGSI